MSEDNNIINRGILKCETRTPDMMAAMGLTNEKSVKIAPKTLPIISLGTFN